MRPSTLVLVVLVMATTTCVAPAMHNHIFPWYEFKRSEARRIRRPVSEEDYDVMLPMGGTSPQSEDTRSAPVDQAVPYSVESNNLPVEAPPLQNRLAWMYVCYNQKTAKWRFCRGDPGKAEKRISW